MGPADPIEKLTEAFGTAVEKTETFRDETTITIAGARIEEVARFCRDEEGLKYNLLADIAALDYYPQEPRIGVCYHLYSLKYNRRLRLKVMWTDGDDAIPTVTSVWKSADWEEREAYDMFGVLFKGHPDLRRILMPVDWEGHPQRKDYPLGYETVQFSFNFDEIQKHKPYAKK